MVEELFRQDAYLKDADATVTAVEERGVRLDRTIFYPTGGGQPGDSGVLRWDGGEAKVVDAVKADGGDVLHVLAPDAPRPAVGAKVQAILDWDRRYRHMRMHTALHVMSAVIKGNVTGGQVNCRQEPARLQPGRRRADQGMGDRGDQQDPRRRPAGDAAMGDRRGAQRAARAGEDHERAPADGRGPRAPARRSRASTCRPAAARTWRAPARSAASSAPRSRTRGR